MAARHHGHVLLLPILGEDGVITEGGVHQLKEALVAMPGLVEMLAEFLGHRHKLEGELFEPLASARDDAAVRCPEESSELPESAPSSGAATWHARDLINLPR